jgi:2-polyprenyl-3-methyl-5-hydroxy-6-metoxy-1,4-benzoquinol methylase
MSKGNKVLKDTGERLIPEYHQNSLIYAEHYTRYSVATDIVRGKVVLDIASGAGYGSNMLAKTAKKVYGVDLDPKAVQYAQRTYGRKNIEFIAGSGTAIPLKDSSVDVVVTFETIEHIEEYQQFMQEIKRVLKPDGLAIISTPNDLEFAEGNHFHVHEFEYTELKNLIGQYFTQQRPYFQATWKSVAIGEEAMFTNQTDQPIPFVNLAPLRPEQYLYFYVLCSNRKITESISPVVASGEHYSERQMVNDYTLTKNELERREQKYEELHEHYRAAMVRVGLAEEELKSLKDGIVFRSAHKVKRALQPLRSKVKRRK